MYVCFSETVQGVLVKIKFIADIYDRYKWEYTLNFAFTIPSTYTFEQLRVLSNAFWHLLLILNIAHRYLFFLIVGSFALTPQ